MRTAPLMRLTNKLLVLLLLGAAPSSATAQQQQSATPPPGVLRAEFIYTEAPFPSCHASTIAQTEAGLVAAWFGGTREKHPDVGIWLARHDGKNWSAPVEVANGVQAAGQRYPTWNPVLFKPEGGPLLLFYKVGPSPSRWWGMVKESRDHGRTWGEARRLPESILGPIKNKPVQLRDGTLLCPSSTEHAGWRVHLERTPDLGATWQQTPPLNDGRAFGAIQPTILTHPGDVLQILCRSTMGKIVESWSRDGGKTWDELKPIDLPHPDSGIDAVTLRDGRALLVYNHTRKGRSPLNVALSSDGKVWKPVVVLENEPGEYSYPAVIQTSDGLVHITYTWKRQRIKHVVIDPGKLQ